jgi:hypothetical protein
MFNKALNLKNSNIKINIRLSFNRLIKPGIFLKNVEGTFIYFSKKCVYML